MYISSDVLDWNFYSENGTGLSFEEEEVVVGRAHDMWRHASSLITPECSEFSRIDAITGLKRAVNHRLKSITDAYCFHALPFTSQKKILEKLQFYGIIRPTLLKEIFELRNAIEHMDTPPPSIEQCNRYVDIIWYFLKSTDSLLSMRPDEIKFWSDDNEGTLDFDVKFNETWVITVIGELPAKYFLEHQIPDALEIDESIERPQYIHSTIYGLWKPSAEQLCTFARKYFQLSGYWWEDHEQP